MQQLLWPSECLCGDLCFSGAAGVSTALAAVASAGVIAPAEVDIVAETHSGFAMAANLRGWDGRYTVARKSMCNFWNFIFNFLHSFVMERVTK